GDFKRRFFDLCEVIRGTLSGKGFPLSRTRSGLGSNKSTVSAQKTIISLASLRLILAAAMEELAPGLLLFSPQNIVEQELAGRAAG
ncbi:hypothetical protein OAF79_02840, partial [Akkermansiaceae bacterium]|nr:hypothetical protein [Akkermansiaceae bacterium]